MLSHLLLVGKIFVILIGQTWTKLRLRLRSIVHRFTYQAGSQPKNIVIVGASFAGYHAARCLANSLPSGYRVVVIEKNSHFQLTWVLPRFCVVDGHDNKAFIPYGSYVKGPPGSCHWVRDIVTSVIPAENKGSDRCREGSRGGNVKLASGDSIPYEYLVLATGSAAGLPSRVCETDKEAGMKALSDQRQKIAKAQDIVVVGGGPAGIELAADAKAQFPEKRVTLIHSRATLLNDGFGTKMHLAICEEMDRLGVNLVLGQKPSIPDGMTGSIKLSGGDVIHYDCLIKCVGQKPNSSLLSFLSPETFTRSGYIRVQPSLQVLDDAFPEIYAAGDVIEAGAIKNARSAVQQAQTVAVNICRHIHGQRQIEYMQQWWEGTTKLTLGVGKSVVYITDYCVEVLFSSGRQKIELDSAMVWKYFGAKPYVDH
ncbi:hypothetical protein N7466_003459 [Penicillium verhagenii]|uniref:uncharacterized protein n=1 Tax=Penicillium verhagenii TaxID=1562060 RepID=UPI002545A9EA|nr:uncharacterized protein N7466_003459 [Penicillium verhagenii]KAJ5937009.1 hypothetical protein N7466_003459 [Penicillium verhagenii]